MKKPKFFGDLDQLGHAAFLEAVRKPRIVTCPEGVITYTIAKENMKSPGAILQQVFDPQEIDGKLREILTVAPDVTLVKLKKIGQDLGISIQNFEKAKPPAPPPEEEDVIF